MNWEQVGRQYLDGFEDGLNGQKPETSMATLEQQELKVIVLIMATIIVIGGMFLTAELYDRSKDNQEFMECLSRGGSGISKDGCRQP